MRTAKDCRPQHHTHTHTCYSAFLPSVTFGGWFVPAFVCRLFGCLGCPVASSYWHVLLCREQDLAGRSHGPGCTAASYTGAIQWHSLSPGRPPVSSKDCAHGSCSSFSDQKLFGWPSLSLFASRPWEGETQIWPGDLRLAFRLLCFALGDLICQFACDHLCPC